MTKIKRSFTRIIRACRFDDHIAAHAIIGGRHRGIIKPTPCRRHKKAA